MSRTGSIRSTSDNVMNLIFSQSSGTWDYNSYSNRWQFSCISSPTSFSSMHSSPFVLRSAPEHYLPLLIFNLICHKKNNSCSQPPVLPPRYVVFILQHVLCLWSRAQTNTYCSKAYIPSFGINTRTCLAPSSYTWRVAYGSPPLFWLGFIKVY